jgi:hypothetical protein
MFSVVPAPASTEEKKAHSTEMTLRTSSVPPLPPLTRMTAIAHALDTQLPRELLALVHAFCIESLRLYYSYRESAGAFARCSEYQSAMMRLPAIGH